MTDTAQRVTALSFALCRAQLAEAAAVIEHLRACLVNNRSPDASVMERAYNMVRTAHYDPDLPFKSALLSVIDTTGGP